MLSNDVYQALDYLATPQNKNKIPKNILTYCKDHNLIQKNRLKLTSEGYNALMENKCLPQ